MFLKSSTSYFRRLASRIKRKRAWIDSRIFFFSLFVLFENFEVMARGLFVVGSETMLTLSLLKLSNWRANPTSFGRLDRASRSTNSNGQLGKVGTIYQTPLSPIKYRDHDERRSRANSWLDRQWFWPIDPACKYRFFLPFESRNRIRCWLNKWPGKGNSALFSGYSAQRKLFNNERWQKKASGASSS